MKWFKHFTDSLDDPFIVGLMDEFGHTGYVAFFGLIEIICKENGHNVTGELSVSPTYLRRKLRTTPAKLREVFEYCRSNGRLLFDYSGKEWKFQFDKVVKIKDNHTANLQAANKKLALEEEVEVEGDKEEDKRREKPKSPRLPVQDFFNSWNQYKGYLPTAKELTKGRREKIKARLRERPLDDWQKIFKFIVNSDFCRGKNDRGWKASLDWIIANEDNAVKVLEGKYMNTDNGTSQKEMERAAHEKRETAARKLKAEFMAKEGL